MLPKQCPNYVWNLHGDVLLATVLPFLACMKQGLATVLKAVAGLAGFVALMAPITDSGLVITGIALLVAIIAGVIGIHLSDDDDEGQSGGYWPSDPNTSGSR